MKKLKRLLPLLAVMLMMARWSSAAPIATGDWVHFNGSNGTLGGGAFTIHDVSNSAVADFLSFCLQATQYINYSENFRVGSITDFADDAAGADPLDVRTTWIMSNFSRGLLTAYSSDDVQWAIWKLEGEQSGDWGKSVALINAADLGVLGGWSNDGAKVLNLFRADGTLAQDQLVFTPVASVPEPATVLLLGIGLGLLVYQQRRARKLARSRTS